MKYQPPSAADYFILSDEDRAKYRVFLRENNMTDWLRRAELYEKSLGITS